MNFFSFSPSVKRVRRAAVMRLAILCLLIFSCCYSFADRKDNVLLVASKSTVDYVEVLNSVKRQLEAENSQGYAFNTRFHSSEIDLKNDLSAADYIVTVGTTAADAIYKAKPNAPIISVLITENAFLVLAEKHYGSVEKAFAAQVSSICLDQPVNRSIQLAKLLISDVSKVGVMLGPASADRQVELSHYIVSSGLQPQFVAINAKDNPIHKIEPVLSRSDVFIPISDSRLINIATAKWILHLSYRHKVPVIAFSKSYLKAGALAAIYSSPEDVAQDAAEWLIKAKGKTVGNLYKPAHYSLKFNKSVAGNLKIKLDTEQFYRGQFGREVR
jgi:putative tryptophan/tyrosine transport system substrate-binding protein